MTKEKLMNKAADKKDMEDFNKSLEEAQSRVESLKTNGMLCLPK